MHDITDINNQNEKLLDQWEGETNHSQKFGVAEYTGLNLIRVTTFDSKQLAEAAVAAVNARGDGSNAHLVTRP